jgi:hypothetical protein
MPLLSRSKRGTDVGASKLGLKQQVSCFEQTQLRKMCSGWLQPDHCSEFIFGQCA